MKFDERLNKIIDRHSEINNQLIDPGISSDQRTRLSKEYAELSPIIEAANNLRKVREEMSDLSYLITDKDTEKEFRDLAEQEFATLKQGEPELERQVQVLLLPGDQDDAKNVII